MFAFLICDKDTGEIETCFISRVGDAAEVQEFIDKEDRYPWHIDEGWQDSYCSILLDEKDIPDELKYGTAKAFREEFKVFPDEINAKHVATKLHFEKRKVRGKINEITGKIVDDPEQYSAEVSKAAQEMEEERNKEQNILQELQDAKTRIEELESRTASLKSTGEVVKT